MRSKSGPLECGQRAFIFMDMEYCSFQVTPSCVRNRARLALFWPSDELVQSNYITVS